MGLARLTGERVQRCARAGPATSAGPDGWMPAELKYLPASAFGLLVALYNAVEEGAPWPKE
eukprot:4354139-Alexandrium_andersonii.AAC.1